MPASSASHQLSKADMLLRTNPMTLDMELA
jgi:hypothetical protein